MDKEALWRAYVRKHPPFEGDGNITLSKAGLKKFFDTTYDIAEKEGEKKAMRKAQWPDVLFDMFKK